MATKQDDKGVKVVAPGTALFHEGQPGDRMYVIKRGRVQLSKKVMGENIVLEELGAGEFCGELALINDQPRAVTAVVIQEAELIPVDAAQFEGMLRGNADIAVRMMKKMCQRLTQAQYRISNLAMRSNAGRLLHQLRAEATRRDGRAPLPENLAEVLNLEIGEIKRLLNQFVRDELISVDPDGYFTVIDNAAIDRYLRFLELGDRFDYISAAPGR